MNEEKREFFISYTRTDTQWAEWIAGTLESNGQSCYLQAWDFRPGDNFVLNMHKALKNSERFIAVLSDDYLKSMYCQAEWAAAFTKDPNSEKRFFIPVRVADIKPNGLFAAIIYIDLFGKDGPTAEKALLHGVDTKDIPRNRPSFPGIAKARFPGSLPFNNLPYSKNGYFTGRDDVLKEISDRFECGQTISLTQAITGLGGLGKTQIALEYAYRYCSRYDYIWWVPAETETTVLNAYRDFAWKMGLVNKDQHDNEIIIESVQTWMDNNPKWLFIYDNADTICANDNWWPQNNRENILITTRNRSGYIGKSLDISVFSEDESIAFLEKRTEITNERSNAVLLSKHLGYLPLALEQAAAYIKINKCTYAEYISLLDEYGLEPLKEIDGIIAYEQPVTATWEISIHKVNNESARQIMYLCSYLASENIDREMFSKNKNILSELLQNELSSKIKTNKIWSELTKYSLLEKQGESTYSMHRLLQEVVRDKLKCTPQWAKYCLAILCKIYEFTYEAQVPFILLLPHVDSFVENSNAILSDDRDKMKISSLCMQSGNRYYYLKNYHRAFNCYSKALVILERILGSDHPDTAITYNNIAGVYKNQGNYVLALEWYFKALNIREKVLRSDHPATAETYNNIATVYINQGDYVLALEWYIKALIIFKEEYGLEHPNIAIASNNIAMVYFKQGDYVLALEWFNRAKVIFEKVCGLNHHFTATAYNNIGLIYNIQDNYLDALEWFEKALAMRKNIFDWDHPDIAMSYNNIASVYDSQGDYEKALKLYKKALATFEKVLGVKHLDTATCYNNIASVYNNQDDYVLALKWHEKALAIFKEILGSEHPNVKMVQDSIKAIKERT